MYTGISTIKLYNRWYHILKQYTHFKRNKLVTRPDVLRPRKFAVRKALENFSNNKHYLDGLRVESTTKSHDKQGQLIGTPDADGYTSFQSIIDRGVVANETILQAAGNPLSFTVDELIHTNKTLSLFMEARYSDGGYELYCCSVTRGGGGEAAAIIKGTPPNVKAHRMASGACLIDNMGNSFHNYKSVTNKNRHNLMLLRIEDYYGARLQHPVTKVIDPQPWRRFTR